MKIKILFLLIIVSVYSEAGAIKVIKELFVHNKTVTKTVVGKTLNYTLTSKIASSLLVAYGLTTLPNYASEVYDDMIKSKSQGDTSYKTKVCPARNSDKYVVVPSDSRSCLDGSRPRSGPSVDFYKN